jgi:hypothetical protein
MSNQALGLAYVRIKAVYQTQSVKVKEENRQSRKKSNIRVLEFSLVEFQEGQYRKGTGASTQLIVVGRRNRWVPKWKPSSLERNEGVVKGENGKSRFTESVQRQFQGKEQFIGNGRYHEVPVRST